jgi:hypothetical protein
MRSVFRPTIRFFPAIPAKPRGMRND